MFVFDLGVLTILVAGSGDLKIMSQAIYLGRLSRPFSRAQHPITNRAIYGESFTIAGLCGPLKPPL